MDGKDSVYIHCAPEGRKLEALKDNNKVSLCVIGEVNLLPDKFTTEYESALFFGTAHIQLSKRREDESPAPAHRQAFCRLQGHRRQIRQQELPRVEIIRIDFTEFSGKQKKVPQLHDKFLHEIRQTKYKKTENNRCSEDIAYFCCR
ncbi:pyridoxamine 5'-phosphate oxidase family protein [Prevotella intermedia]|uniref:pyridoxamine 5'-phosphate oxidase family protein n=1 Tax=Prevotella intermedia TaxID=28131 RepID=UPI0012FE7FE1|nr:pyridoxamine 5'-phosphate oxidase family protein [Prevotella intermedia]